MIINSLCELHRNLSLEVKKGGAEKSKTPPRPKNAQAQQEKPDPIHLQSRFAAAPKKTAIYLELAARFVTNVWHYQKEGKERILSAAREEKRRLVKYSYSLIASSTAPELVRQAFCSAGLSSAAGYPDECESEMFITGTRLAITKAHPVVIMRSMTAYLGLQVFDQVESWLLEHFGEQGEEDEELIIPGDLSEILSDKRISPGQINLAIHMAGNQLVAASLAGCPRHTVDLVKSLAYSRLGGALLDWNIREARSRLSSDELSDAQSAFMELLGSLDEPNPAELRQEDWSSGVDESLVADISDLILELDERVLKSVVAGLEPALLASLIQAMEPIAHDRLFSCAPSSRSKKILNALEAATPLSLNELTRRAQIFAQKVLSELAPKTRHGAARSLQLSASLRQHLTSILSRE